MLNKNREFSCPWIAWLCRQSSQKAREQLELESVDQSCCLIQHIVLLPMVKHLGLSGCHGHIHYLFFLVSPWRLFLEFPEHCKLLAKCSPMQVLYMCFLHCKFVKCSQIFLTCSHLCRSLKLCLRRSCLTSCKVTCLQPSPLQRTCTFCLWVCRNSLVFWNLKSWRSCLAHLLL